MADNETRPTKVRPATFLKQIGNEQKRKDSRELVALSRRDARAPLSYVRSRGRAQFGSTSGGR